MTGGEPFLESKRICLRTVFHKKQTVTSVFDCEKLLGLKGACICVTVGGSRVQSVPCPCVSVVTGSGTRSLSDGKCIEFIIFSGRGGGDGVD